MTIKITAAHEKFIDAANTVYPGQVEFSNSQVKKIVAESGCPKPSWFLKPAYRVGYGTYSLELAGVSTTAEVVDLPVGNPSVGSIDTLQNDVVVIPETVKEYVPF